MKIIILLILFYYAYMFIVNIYRITNLKNYLSLYFDSDDFTININKTVIHNYSSKHNSYTGISIHLLSKRIIINDAIIYYGKWYVLMYPFIFIPVIKKFRKSLTSIDIDKLPVY